MMNSAIVSAQLVELKEIMEQVVKGWESIEYNNSNWYLDNAIDKYRNWKKANGL